MELLYVQLMKYCVLDFPFSGEVYNIRRGNMVEHLVWSNSIMKLLIIITLNVIWVDQTVRIMEQGCIARLSGQGKIDTAKIAYTAYLYNVLNLS